MTTDVPPVVQQQLLRFKQALVNVVDAAVLCHTGTSTALQAALHTAIGATPPQIGTVPGSPGSGTAEKEVSSEVYGKDLTIALTHPGQRSDLLAAQVSFSIQCGDDNLLLLYQREGPLWRRVLRWQSPPYQEISGAFGGAFLFGLLPGSGGTPWRIVATHGTDWCTSRFSGASIDLLEPAPDGAAPRILWHTERSLSRGDFATVLKIHGDNLGDEFEIRWNAPSLDLDHYERTVIYHYRVQGDTVTRLEPIAVNGRGFVAEWLEMPWTEAAAQTAAANLLSLHQLHAHHTETEKNAKTYVRYTDGPVRSCRASTPEFEVEMNAHEPDGSVKPQFFRIRQTGNGYSMLNESTSASPNCSGPDLTARP